jgi:DNA anti-recombination protein RmuC
VSFLNSLKSTLEHLEKYVGNTPQSELSQDIAKLLQKIRGPWDEFKKFLDKYKKSLGKSSTKSELNKAPRTIQHTVKDISGNVEKLRRQIEQPL